MLRLSAALLVVAFLLGGPARAEDPPPASPVAPLSVPLLQGFALDGRLDEAAWSDALLLSADTIKAPGPPPKLERESLTPVVRIAQSAGRLWFGVSLAEDPGMGMGLRVLVGPEGVASAAEAVALSYAPQEIRTARYIVRGPRGLTRTVYRAEGAAEWRRTGTWSLELSLPLEDLALEDPASRLRLALAVDSRTNNLGAGAPAGVLFAMPTAWALLQPAGGAWTTGATADAQRIAEEDRIDDERVQAWHAFDAGQNQPLPPGPPEEVRALVEKRMLAPLAKIAGLRPDLVAWVEWVRGTLLTGLNEAEGAERAYRAALAAMPGMREAAYQLHVKLLGPAFAEGLANQPSDYAQALTRLEGERAKTTDPYAVEGLTVARGLLLYRRGDFVEARGLLEPLAQRYPQDALIRRTLEHASAYVDAWADEALIRKREDARADLPRARLTTSRGPVTVELFEDDAPNTVKNFVWLAEHGFYDGTAFHRNVPFFVIQGGDPFTREGADPTWVGAGGPGYAIATEALSAARQRAGGVDPGGRGQSGPRRRAFRGTIVMAAVGRDSEGSQFFLTTGSAAHLDGTVSVFGRIVEGQAAADALVENDRLTQVEVLRKRPGTEYRPLTLGQKPAPEPVATGPRR